MVTVAAMVCCGILRLEERGLTPARLVGIALLAAGVFLVVRE